jgi:hypothetical protein
MPAAKKTKTSKKAMPMKSKKSQAWHEKHYFMDEQDKFHQDHPNSKMLLMVFCVLVVAFFAVYYMMYLQ